MRSVGARLHGVTVLTMRFPLVSQAVATCIVLSYLVSWLMPKTIDSLALIPTNTMITHFYLWNILTSGLFEVHLALALLTATGVLFIGEQIEPLWGVKVCIMHPLLAPSVSNKTIHHRHLAISITLGSNRCDEGILCGRWF